VALTASDDEEVRTRASAAGCDMHVVKPVNGRLLVSIVHAALDGLAPISRVEFAESQASGPGDVVVQVEPFMADLVPEYVREKRRQVRELRLLLDAGDLRQVQRIAHDLKGTGTAYGIPDVTRLGRELEAAGQRADAAAASALVEELDTLLAGVQRRLGA
jgi:HPt (histidine-containing phosphotransfer) domain-containing protein